MQVHVRVPATTANLGPGFDCLGLALDIWNTITVRESREGEQIEWRSCAARGGPAVAPAAADPLPAPRDNLVLQAIRLGFRRARVRPPDLAVTIENCIPIGRGLGSSAAAIVAGLVAANRWLGDRFSREELLALATDMEGHPDNVSAALLGGLTISVREGGRVLAQRLAPPRGWRAALFVPVQRLSTQLARSVLPLQIPRADGIFNLGRTALLVHAFARADAGTLDLAMRDALHQPYRAPLVPGMQELFAAARRAGASGAALSGAGPTLLALAESEEQAERAAGAMARRARSLQIEGATCVVRLAARGAAARTL